METSGKTKDNRLPFEEAAEKRTVEGWVCKHCGRFYGNDERTARFCCAKDMACNTDGCDIRAKKGYRFCTPCAKELSRERWLALEAKEWDRETPLCIFEGDTYFFSEDDLVDYLDENDLAADEILLVICKKSRKPEFCMDDIMQDYFPEVPDYDASPRPIESVVNQWIGVHVPTSWEPDKVRTTLISIDIKETE